MFLCVYKREIIMGLILFLSLARGASRSVQSCLLDLEGSSKNRRQDLAWLVFTRAPCFEPRLTYFFMMSVQFRECPTHKEKLSNWLLEILVPVATCQVHFERTFYIRAFESTSWYAWFAMQKATVWAYTVLVLTWNSIMNHYLRNDVQVYCVELVMRLVVSFYNEI